MACLCPICGEPVTSSQRCGRCLADLSLLRLALNFCPVAPGRQLPLMPEQQAALLSSGVTPGVLVTTPQQAWRVSWFAHEVWASWKPQVLHRLSCLSPALPPGRLVEDEAGVWLLVETSQRPFVPWLAPRAADVLDQLEATVTTVAQVAATLTALHLQGLVWLTFQPTALEWHDALPGEPSLRCTNLDAVCYPSGRLPAGLAADPHYLAPEIHAGHSEQIGPATDVFHLALFAYHALAGLWPGGIAGGGLAAFAYALPSLRVYVPELPPRVDEVLQRGLQLRPAERYPTPTALCEALRAALACVRERYAAQPALRWEIGEHSRTGRAKSAVQRINEDHVLCKSFPQPPRALVAVADGISSCDIGNGALASRLTGLVLENTFDEHSSAATFAPRLVEACQRASALMLEWGLENGHRHALETGSYLMGSTLLAGWLEGSQLALGNLGDSRAYLIEADHLEQLTVDGDLTTSLLAEGTPPEEVRALGSYGRALRDCVGGSVRVEEGQLEVPREHSTPLVRRWPLLPGDIVVLCTDGLVEEGFFLEPSELATLVRENRDLPAEELARLLADAADDCQRLPSLFEPEGFGDNISCAVIKIHRAGDAHA